MAIGLVRKTALGVTPKIESTCRCLATRAGVIACAITLSVGIALAATSRTPVPAVEEKPHSCRIEGVSEDVLCAIYPVWEDRERATGRRIGLNIVILPALGPEKSEVPLFIFHGGPGAAATELVPAYSSSKALRSHRDIVFIDQRGTGRSNPLDCDLYGEPPDLQRVVSETFPVEVFRRCRERLDKVADLRMYTTAPAMDDYDDVRRWLHYEKINIWGGSYGTVAAQVYLRRHGASVRSAVLAAVAPVDELIPLHHAWAGQRAVDEIFRKCDADLDCTRAYPRLREDFQVLFDRVRKGVDVELHDRSGRTVRVRPSVSGFADSIRHFLYYGDGASFPSEIHHAARGDLAHVVQIAVNAQIGLMQRLSMGMNLSVTCAEDVPFIDDSTMLRETANTFLGPLRIQEQRAACETWVRGPVPRDVHDLVRTDVPILLLSGARDSVTPPSFAERAAKYMTNHLHIVFPESSHGNWGPCGARIQAEFFDRGAVKGLDISCVAEQRPTKFIYSSRENPH